MLAGTAENPKGGTVERPFRILSIDGGGIRGLIPALLLAELEKQAGKPVADLFDLIVGTSTGGIIALGLATPSPDGRPRNSAQDLANLYLQQGARIFHRDPFFFRSRRAKLDPRYDYPLWLAARATSAAPTYFEPVLIAWPDRDRDVLVDGPPPARHPGRGTHQVGYPPPTAHRRVGSTNLYFAFQHLQQPAEPQHGRGRNPIGRYGGRAEITCVVSFLPAPPAHRRAHV
jgi:hypothetical protein